MDQESAPKPKPQTKKNKKKPKKKSSDPIKKFFDKLMKPINKIIGYFKCGIEKIKNLYYCIAFYIIYIIISVFFTIWNIFVAPIVGIKAGNKAWNFISKYVPKKIMKCFLC
jgi:hypothetical protein